MSSFFCVFNTDKTICKLNETGFTYSPKTNTVVSRGGGGRSWFLQGGSQHIIIYIHYKYWGFRPPRSPVQMHMQYCQPLPFCLLSALAPRMKTDRDNEKTNIEIYHKHRGVRHKHRGVRHKHRGVRHRHRGVRHKHRGVSHKPHPFTSFCS